MLCRKCGAPIQSGHNFCTDCGFEISEETLSDEITIDQSDEEEYARFLEEERFEKKNDNKALYITILICVVILAVVVTFFIMFISSGNNAPVSERVKNSPSQSDEAWQTPEKSNDNINIENDEIKTELIIGYDLSEQLIYKDSNGNLTGFDIELAKLVCDEMGLTPIFKRYDRDKLTYALDSGEIDCIWAGYRYDEDNDANIVFTDIYLSRAYYETYADETHYAHYAVAFNEESDMVQQVDDIINELASEGKLDEMKIDFGIIYRVRLSANDEKSQIGSFIDYNRAIALADSRADEGYEVYSPNGDLIYKP